MPTAVSGRPAELPGERPAGSLAALGHRPVAPRGTGWAVGWIGALTICQAALMVGIGLLITGPAHDLWPMTVEDQVNSAFARMRTDTLTALSSIASEAGNTETVIAVTLVSCLGLLLMPKLPRWRQATFLALAVSLQSLVFLVITVAVDRDRPDVHRLDGSLPTSSYTSGHTGAATAVYGGLAVLALSRIRSPWRRIIAAALFLVPIVVGIARLYRGMHHPTDVAGGLVNGGLSLWIVGRAVLADGFLTAPLASEARTTPEAKAEGRGQRSGHVAVIINPTVTGPSDRDALRQVLAQHGHRTPEFIETTADDPGGGQTSEAVRNGATLVVVCGGDGTLRAAATALAGSTVPLVLVPCGTGNLLARNLGLPLSAAHALDAALRGTVHRVDLGRIEADGLPPTHFAAMCGAGLDAAMLQRANAHDSTKSLLGWPAYVLALPRAWRRAPRMTVDVRLDGAAAVRRTARMVLIGNVGAVQGGMRLLPDARCDDGRLDLLILDPHGLGGWIRALWTLLRGAASPQSARNTPGEQQGALGADAPVAFFTFRQAEFTFDRAQPRELDGDPVAPGRRLSVEASPGALTMLLPAREK
ncbi:diacylglycerol kinase family enzyme [Streptomyces sp. TLI_55]|uniref:diacylglycerol kinase family protein n=1 Tax=Streptomyces sp. TLI_55 TaxID=1938861 RepID=UPI000BCE24CF|nr:diacylglycerol kinase family enzyme [Streptomyces sp. TLI_55]